tara:strand:+ start:2966 stop:4210 length:1245 start_codon:yes stop_codon:yes gene_type:complete
MIFSLFSIMDRQVISLMVDPIKQDLGLTDTQLGLLQGLAFALFYALAGLPIGWAVDRYSRRKIIGAGVVFWSFSAISCGLARNFGQLFAARSCVGVGEATLGPIAVSLISDIFPRDKVATPLGIYSAGFYLGSGVALAVGGWIVSLFIGQPSVAVPLIGEVAPWQAVFIVTGIPGLPVALLALAVFDPRKRAVPDTHKVVATQQSFFSFLRERKGVIALAITGFAASTFVVYAASAWTPAFFIRVHGWKAEEIGWVYGLVVALSGATGALIGGLVIDRVYRAGYHDATLRVPAFGALASCVPFATAYLVSSATMALALICVGMGIISLGGGASYAVWQKIAPAHFRGRITALYIMCASLIGAGFGPVTVGAITDYAFGDPLAVGKSIAWTIGVCMPTISFVFFKGCGKLRQLPG